MDAYVINWILFYVIVYLGTKLLSWIWVLWKVLSFFENGLFSGTEVVASSVFTSLQSWNQSFF